jgi:hypothetical protein
MATRSHLRWLPSLAFLLPFAVYLAWPAATLNYDGLGYYYCAARAEWAGKFPPGHLLYCPLTTVLGWLGEAVRPGSLRHVMVLVNQVAVATAAFLVYRIAHRLGLPPLGRWVAGLGLAFSYGAWIQAVDVETYALALVFVTGSILVMVRYGARGTARQLVLLGGLNSLAALFHLATLSVAGTSLALILWRQRESPRRALQACAIYLSSLGLFFLGPLLLVAVGLAGVTTLGELLAWLHSSGHGFRIVVDALSIARAVYGLARSFVVLEFFWEASRLAIALKGAFLLVGAAWAVWQIPRAWRQLGATAKMILASSSVFVLTQAGLGVYFYGSDSERWIFILPLLWLLLAGAVSATNRRPRAPVVAGLVLMFLLNLTQGIYPSSGDSSTERHVRALERVLPRHAVIVTPGGDHWLDYYHYFTGHRPDTIDLLHLALALRTDHSEFFASLEDRIGEAVNAHRPVVMIRVNNPLENYRRTPWQELAAFGYEPGRLREWFTRYQWDEMRLDDPGGTRVYRLRHGVSAHPVAAALRPDGEAGAR